MLYRMARTYVKIKKSYKKGKNSMGLTKRVKKVERKVNHITRTIEDKVITYGLTTLTGIQQTVPYTQLLNPLAQGTTDSTRLGKEVTYKMIDLRIYLGIATNAFRAQSVFRVILVKERPSLGGSLSLNSLLGTNTPQSISVYNFDNRDWKSRFTVYYDQVHRVDGIVFSKSLRIKKKLNFTTNYARGNAGDVTDIDSNSLWLVILTDYPADLTSLGYKYEYNLFYEDA